MVAQIYFLSSALQRLENWMGLATLLCPVVPVRCIPWQWHSCREGAGQSEAEAGFMARCYHERLA